MRHVYCPVLVAMLWDHVLMCLGLSRFGNAGVQGRIRRPDVMPGMKEATWRSL